MSRETRGRRAGLAGIWRALRRSGEDPRARLAAAEIDLRERDAEVAGLRAEYERLSGEYECALAEARGAGMQALAGQLAQPFAQLASMQALAERGREVSVADVLKLVARAEAVLLEAGMTRLGVVGERAVFDPHLHRPLADGEIAPGTAVTIRFLGYRLGETVLLRALVSPSDAHEGRAAEVAARGVDG